MARKRTAVDPELIVTIDSLDKILPIAEDILHRVAAETGESPYEMKPARFKYALSCMFNEIVFPNKNLLTIGGVGGPAYDQYAVKYLYLYVYKPLNNRYNQRISLNGFEYFTGIDNQTIYNWSNDTEIVKNHLYKDYYSSGVNNIYNTDTVNPNIQLLRECLSTLHFDLYKLIKKDSEESTVDIMLGDPSNPTKYIAYLNHHHNWNGAGTTSERARVQMLTAADLPKLCLPETDNSAVNDEE